MTKRVLAIDPNTRGFAYAVLEGGERLIDWGLVEVRSEDIYRERIIKLLDRFKPEIMVLEDERDSRRGSRARSRNQSAEACAKSGGLKVWKVTRARVRRVFVTAGKTRYEIALAISRWFPELSSRLPKKHRIWESEDRRMAIFSAVSFALTIIREQEFGGE